MTSLANRLASQRSAICALAMLYAGKTSGILVGFLFLPMYSRLLGPSQFGTVAVIFALQALLTMMDLGMSTMLGREIAAGTQPAQRLRKLLSTAEICLSCFYIGLLVVGLALKAAGFLGAVGWELVAATTVLFLVLVLQNLYYSAMVARGAYSTASMIQVTGALLRAIISVYALGNVSASLEVFVGVQLVCAAIHAVVSRRYCVRNIGPRDTGGWLGDVRLQDCMDLAKQGGALVVFSAAGAAVTQLDKPLISTFMSPASLSPYFLATTLCMAPIALLAGPVSQYFQPKLIGSISNGVPKPAREILFRFVLATVVITCLPSFVFWMFREAFIAAWLGRNGNVDAVAKYVAILLPGYAAGALGFVPYSLLLAAKDYRFQAWMSACMTILTLSAVTVAAKSGGLDAVCWIYVAYHAGSTLASWFRAATLSSVALHGKQSLFLILKLSSWCILGGCLFYGFIKVCC